jgi:branched-chain amino acid aminotransferase
VSGEELVLWVNGRLVPAGEARLDPRDRGFALGDGVFETMRAREGVVLLVERHLARLKEGARTIGLPLPWDEENLKRAILETVEANVLSEAAVRLAVSRGVPRRRGLPPEPDPEPTLVIHAERFAGYPDSLHEEGMRAATSRLVRRNEHSPLSNVKTLSYLDNMLARRESSARGADEALLLNASGNLACASAANLFLVLGEELVTPDLASGALPGTVRDVVMNDLAPCAGLEVAERAVKPEELIRADEAFLTSALLGVAPLVEADDLAIGGGKPGPVTGELAAELEGLWSERSADLRRRA